MTENAISFRLTENEPGAVAMFGDNGIIYHNEIFESAYHPLRKSAKEEISRVFARLRSELVQSNKPVMQRQVSLFPDSNPSPVIVYLLNKSGSRKQSLVVVVPRGVSAASKDRSEDIPFFNPGRSIGFDNSRKVELSSAFSRLIGEDIHFKAVLFKAQKAAQSDYPILIKGESGTGKEILANTIHNASRRRKKKFVDINCAAIPDQLIDSELFGYEKGAFTGALPGGRHGMFVEADKGTLFLDEIADASLQTQAKLLRVLNEGYFKRVGGVKNIAVDVRIISATNKDLSKMIEEDHFRQDLIYRLNTITINLPPLRNRAGDIPLLADFFLENHSKKTGHPLKLSAGCLEGLKCYAWPGNVRELKGVIDYMATMATGTVINQTHFPDFLQHQHTPAVQDTETPPISFTHEDDTNLLSKAVQQAERQIITDVLHREKNKSKAIKILGTSRRTFYSKLKFYNIK